MKRVNLLLLFLICTSLIFAKKWDALYINKLLAEKEYDKLISYYKSEYENKTNPKPDLAFKIADLYTKKKDYDNAIYWYNKEFQLLRENKVNLPNMANVYMIKGDYEKALDLYITYAAETGDVKKVIDNIHTCERLIRANSFKDNYELEKYQFNTPADEINLKSLRNNLVYLQQLDESKSKSSKTSEQTFLQAKRLYDKWSPPKKIINNLEKNKIYSNFAFSKDGNRAVFSMKTKTTQDPKSKTPTSETEKIYLATFAGGDLVDIQPFDFNSDQYNCSQPCLNDNATAVYFVSNMKGSAGANDIYKSEFKNGKWTKPENLGVLINTKYNEQNPYYIKNKGIEYLYFSSDRSGGFGSYDIYRAAFSLNIWQDVQLLHAPINSEHNENSYVLDFETQTSYVSSDRPGGKGGFDIYRILPFNLNIILEVKDSTTQKHLEFALIELFDGNNKLNESVTDIDGISRILVSKDKTYTLNITKDGYQTKTFKVNTHKKLNGDSIMVQSSLKPDANYSSKNASTSSFILFRGSFSEASYNKNIKPIARIINLKNNKVKNIEYDSQGYFNLKLMLNNSYDIVVEHNNLKIKDEITTYGLEHGSLKIKNYIINGSKLKTSENKVINPSLVHDSLKLAYFSNNSPSATTKIHTIPTNTNTIANNNNNSNINNNNQSNNTTKNNTNTTNTLTNNNNTNTKMIAKPLNTFDLDDEFEEYEADPKANTNNTANSVPENTQFYYKIQIGTYSKPDLPMDKINSLGSVEISNTYNQYTYRIGKYKNKEEAINTLEKVKQAGYYLAFILHYNNDNIIGIIK